MGKILFCNIGWMSRYRGKEDQPDVIVGGGKYVDKFNRGGEVCNFLPDAKGNVYGYVSTFGKNRNGKEINRKINNIFGTDKRSDRIEGVDVIWLATSKDNGGRHVVGWYRNATVYREKQFFGTPPTFQHRKDKVTTFQIEAREFHCIDINDRKPPIMPRGHGAMGRTPWWIPPDNPKPDVKKYLQEIEALLQGRNLVQASTTQSGQASSKRGNAPANSPYLRYVSQYEVTVNPKHSQLQNQFIQHLKSINIPQPKENKNYVDLQYKDPGRGLIFAEVKPCDVGNARFAIRTAIGQLLDYRHLSKKAASLLIVLDVVPKANHIDLALSNGFGIAHPDRSGFKFLWPD